MANVGISDTISKRRSRAELKRLVLDEGVALLRQLGAAISPAHLTYKEVFERLEKNQQIRVTLGSVHERMWSSIDEFRNEVLVTSMREQAQALSGEAVRDLIGNIGPDPRGVGTLRGVAMDLSRYVTATSNLSDRKLWTAVWAAWRQKGELPKESDLGEALLARYRYLRSATASLVATGRTHTGFMPSRDFFAPGDEERFDHLVGVLTDALSLGLLMQRSLEPDLDPFLLPTGPDAALEEWDFFALGFVALVLGLTDGETPRQT